MLGLLHWCLNCMPDLQPRTGPLQAIAMLPAKASSTAVAGLNTNSAQGYLTQVDSA